MQTQKQLCIFFGKLIEYTFTALNLCSYPCVGPLPRIKMSFFLLQIFVDELMSTPKIIKFFRFLQKGTKNTFLSNPIPYPKIVTININMFLFNFDYNKKILAVNNCLCLHFFMFFFG